MKNKNINYKKMLLLVFIAGFISLLVWHIINQESIVKPIFNPDINARNFHKEDFRGLYANELVAEIKSHKKKHPVFIYLYTTWCRVCADQFSDINKLAHNMQNSNLKFYSIAIDRNLTTDKMYEHFSPKGSLFFQPYFLANKNGFLEFVEEIGGNYNGAIPFLMIIDIEGNMHWEKEGRASYQKIINKINDTNGLSINN
jgi:thiol-disulfide isomerase/thioredoxin